MAGSGLQPSARVYEVNPIQLSNKKKVDAILREFRVLQTNTLISYKDFAAESLSYSDFSTGSFESQQRLKQCNDAYTMSMLTNCIEPFNQGVSLDAMLSSFFTYKLMTKLNPEFKQDLSRMFLNYQDQFIPDIVSRPGFHPFANAVSKYLTGRSVDFMHDQIIDNMESNTLDDMTMTPRQIAALKINFMEQCYVDMRKCDLNDKSFYTDYDRCINAYNKAVAHLNAIAHNSGFDMSVVAEEERFLVGLKMKEDPNYANMFTETHSMFGVTPCDSEDGYFNGSFETQDGHLYTVGGHPDMGAFSPRPPYGVGVHGEGADIESRKSKLKEEWEFFARDCAAMESYIKHDSPCSKSAKRQALAKLNEFKKDFVKRSMNQLASDFGMTGIEANFFVKNNFTKVCDKYCDQANSPSGKNPMGRFSGKYTSFSDDCFKDEVNFAIDREMLEPLADEGVYPVFRTAYVTDGQPKVQDLDAIDRDYQDRLSDMHGKLWSAVKNRYGSDYVAGRTGENILEDMRNNYIDTMTGDELFRLVMHAGNNCSQSYFSENKLCGVRVYNTDEIQRSRQQLNQIVSQRTVSQAQARQRDAEAMMASMRMNDDHISDSYQM